MCSFEQKVVEAGVGTKPDSVIAAELGCDRRKVCYVRNKLAVPPFNGLYKTQEGETCRSLYEAMFDLWLHERGIEHRHEVRVKEIGVVADFSVAGQYIEIVGMVGYHKYDKRLEEKKLLYAGINADVRYVAREEVEQLYSACSNRVATTHERVCRKCGKENFDLVKGVCRGPCYMNQWREKRAKMPCKFCGKLFPSSGENEFCSRDCYWNSMKDGRIPDENVILEWAKTKSVMSIAKELGVKPSSLYMRLRRFKERAKG